jgi:hypothetical protein
MKLNNWVPQTDIPCKDSWESKLFIFNQCYFAFQKQAISRPNLVLQQTARALELSIIECVLKLGVLFSACGNPGCC